MAEKTLLRVTQRRLQQLVQAGVLRRIEQPVFVRERSSPKPNLFTLDRYGAHMVAQRLGIPNREIDWKPRDAERNLLFMDHTLAVSDFRLALQQACLDHGVTLANWTGETVLRRSPPKLEISGDDHASVTVSLVPDGFCKLVLPSGHATWIFLEIDRGTVTVQPRQWQLKSWRRKILAYRRLQESGMLKEHYNADSMIVATVTTSTQRLANILKTAEKAEADGICDHVQAVFNPPRIRFLKIPRYPEAYGMKIGFDYRNGTKTLTFSQRYINEHPEEFFSNFLDKTTLTKLKRKGDQHLNCD